MRLRSIVVGAALLTLPAIAAAEQRPGAVKPSGTAAAYDFVVGTPTVDELQFARQVIPPSPTPTAPTPGTVSLAQSRIVYLNKNGVTVAPGTNDARTNRSTIASASTTIAPWNVSATTWAATVSCMKELFAPFDIQIVEANPGNVPHIEAVFGGSPGQLGLPAGVAGVSPFTTDCSVIENSIVYTFTDVIPADARLACEIQAQEVAHSFGLDHQLLASDPMTYLQYNANRSFKNQLVDCGEDTVRPCGINGSVCRTKQNSVALLTERLGVKGAPGDATAPVVGITSPSNNATVPPGFQITANVTDNVAVAMASLYIDGVASGSTTAAPYTFTTPTTLSEGVHTLKIEATDGANTKTTEITVTVKLGAAPPGGGNGPGTGDGDGSSDVTGGCSTGGGGASLLLGLALVGLVVRRRR